MTRALLTKKFKDALVVAGYYVAVDADGLTATVYYDGALGQCDPAKSIGKLTYRNESVDYDELMRLIRSNSVDAKRMKA